MRRERDGEVGADGVERTVGQIDDAAEREDQRQAERDQEVVDAVEQAVQHLLQKKRHCHGGIRAWADRADDLKLARRRKRPRALRSREAIRVAYAAMLQAFSSGVAAMASSGSFGPGVGGAAL